MVCLKGCPIAKETEVQAIKDGGISNDTTLHNGKVLYEVTNTRNKSMFQYDKDLAKLMVPNRRSPSGPVKGTKSSVGQTNKNFQQPSPKPQPSWYGKSGKSRKSRIVRKVKTKSKKTDFILSSIPNPNLLLAAYSKTKKKTQFIITTTSNFPTTLSPSPIAKSDKSDGITETGSRKLCQVSMGPSHEVHTTLADPNTQFATTTQRPTMPSDLKFATPPRRKSSWKYFGPGLHGGAPPKHSLDSHGLGHKILQEPCQQDVGQVKEDSRKEAPQSIAKKEDSMAIAETYGRTEARPNAKPSPVSKGKTLITRTHESTL